MSSQNFPSVISYPPIANETAVTATTETALWNAALRSAIPAGAGVPGTQWALTATGIMSFASTGTLIITPRFGLTVGAGVTMGANPVAQTTPGVTTNAPWWLELLVTVRTLGAPGANSTVIGGGKFVTGATGAAGTAVAFAIGGTSATVDLSIASGITIGWTLSVAGTVTPQQISFRQVN